ncbi:hypothetical protein K488DRAFT_90143 [Vararia minispora EC-137]|uniref:Uncharacterized protein n=1 Tax=Vararia minispora EC-137 TaxID=1314806 RepID=A0ACB8Q8M3_9AGAM|nr:hypothetical protein K488DRAFT_90143 [Vararia minispora EC-137]
MFSFMKIATFAAVAFGALAFALPQPVASPDVKDVVARQSGLDVTTILQNLSTDLQGPISELTALTSTTATADVVGPIVQSIVSTLQSAVTSIEGQAVGSGNLVVLLSTVINLVVGAAGQVVNLPGVAQADLIIIFQLLDVVLAALIQTVLGLVGGLLVVVVGLVVSLLSGTVAIIIQLGLTAVLSALLI